MASGLTLTKKGLAILALPLICQLVVFVALYDMLQKWDKSAEVAKSSMAASECLSAVIKDLLDMRTGADRLKLHYVFTPEFDEKVRDSFENEKKLRKIYKNQPDKIASIGRAFQPARKTLKLIEDNKLDASSGDLDEFENQELMKNVEKSVNEVIGGIDEALVMLHEERAKIRSEFTDQKVQREFVERGLIVGLVISTLLTCITFLVFVKGLVSRLGVMTDNSYRLAAQEQLNPLVGGNDELARLDEQFHEMAEELTAAHKKETAILDNARDLVCSLDETLTFLNVNNASYAVLGFRPHELMGRKLASLVVTEELDAVLKKFTKEPSIPAFHGRLRNKNNYLVDTLWTVQWSAEQRHFFCVVHDDSERMNAERMRTEVIQMVTHDLRTPLTTVSGFLELLERGDLGVLSERGSRLINGPIRGVEQMLNLTNDLLDMEQMEAGKMKLTIEDQPLAQIFEKAIETTSGVARNAGVRLEARPTEIVVAADGRRIEQILVNLMTNACKFSPRDTTIFLEAVDNGNEVDIRVIDQGRGIPQDHVDAIFDRFRQVKESDSREKRGLGLGLAICKALVELHGGTIKVQSKEGVGSTFSFNIPRGLS